MDAGDNQDFWDPSNYPWQVREDSAAAEWSHKDGYDDQWELIAQHVDDGGELDTAPHPSLRKFYPVFHRPVLEGIRQARVDAGLLIEAGSYDPKAVLEGFAEQRRQEEAREAQVKPGEFEKPSDWDTARIHSTVTRLFTDPVVFSVAGERYLPRLESSALMHFNGRLHILGHADIDTGIHLDGEYKVDMVDSGQPGAGPLAGVLRVVWGSEASIVGAIRCGWVRGRVSCSGLGPAGASKEILRIAGELPVDGGTAVLTTESGTSVWFPGSDSAGHFEVLMAVDKDRTPVGLILDATDVTQFSWIDEVLDEAFVTEWPPDAREFNPDTDEEGTNPNVTLTPPPEKEVRSVEELLAAESNTEEFTGEPIPMSEEGLARGAAHGYSRMKVSTSWTLITADGEEYVGYADTAEDALDQMKEQQPEQTIVNIKKRHARWIWDI